MRSIVLYFIIAGSLFISCDSKQDCCSHTPKTYLRTWILTESGYSIGSGYTITPVPADPAQILTLEENGEITSSVNDLDGYQYYSVVTASAKDNDVVNFYKTKSDKQSSINARAYTIVFGEDVLKLSYHYCIEGCHLGFVPVK